MKKQIRLFLTIWLCLGLAAALGVVCRVQAQGRGPTFLVDPSWPKPLPENWVNGQVSGVCVDAQDNVFIVNRNDMTDKEAEVAHQAPPYVEFDPDGNVVNSFGDWKAVPNITHGCTIDYENNFWTAGNGDGIIQKYTHDGKLLMQIGQKGVVDTSDGTLKGTQFESRPVLHAIRHSGRSREWGRLRRWRLRQQSRSCFRSIRDIPTPVGHQGTKEEADAGVGGAFMQVVHCVVIGNDNLVYVCDRHGDRIQVSDKMGNFKNNI